MALKAPFIWFGGKRKIAPRVWELLGDVDNYVEPFAGSLAVLLGRPGWHQGHCETVNDADNYLSNFWRALKSAPDEVAKWADWPVNETDLFARHLWLVNKGREQLTAGLESDPEWYDAKIAGWWVWGLNSWIGSGWCSGKGPWKQDDAGQGVNRKLPHLGTAGQGVNRQLESLTDYFEILAARLRRIRVCTGDWARVVTDGALSFGSTVGVFLDPPYGDVRDPNLYAVEDLTVAAKVAQWCREHEDDPRLRIILCGYEQEHDLPGWEMVSWSAGSSYQTSHSAGGNSENRHKERLWISPSITASMRSRMLL